MDKGYPPVICNTYHPLSSMFEVILYSFWRLGLYQLWLCRLILYIPSGHFKKHACRVRKSSNQP